MTNGTARVERRSLLSGQAGALLSVPCPVPFGWWILKSLPNISFSIYFNTFHWSNQLALPHTENWFSCKENERSRLAAAMSSSSQSRTTFSSTTVWLVSFLLSNPLESPQSEAGRNCQSVILRTLWCIIWPIWGAISDLSGQPSSNGR